MLAMFRAVLVSNCVLCATLAAQPTVIRPEVNAVRPGWRLLDRRWVQPAGTFRFREIVSPRVEETRLVFDIRPNQDWKPKLINGRRVLGELLPNLDLWSLMYGQSTLIVPNEQRGETMVLFRAENPAVATDVTINGITIAPGGVVIRGATRYDGKIATIEYQSARDGTKPRLTIAFADGRGVDVTGQDLFDLLLKKPQLVRQFLAPLVTELAGANLLRPRPSDVYRAFTDIQPGEEEINQMREILPRLDHEHRSVRDEASAKLDEIGAPMVLTALRLDWSTLSPEQSGRLAEFIRKNSFGEIPPTALRGDLFFLREALNDKDERVRDAARAQLEAMAD